MWFFQHDHDRSWVWLRSRYAVWGCGYNAKARHAWVQGCGLGIDPFLQSRIKVVGILCVCFHVFDGLLWPCCDPVVATFPKAIYPHSRKWLWLQPSTVQISWAPFLSWSETQVASVVRVTQVEHIRARQRDFWERSLGLGRFQLFHPSGFQVCVTVCHGVSECISGNLWLLDSLSDQAWARLGCKRSCTAIRWDEGGTKGWAAGLGMAGFNYSN